MENRNCQNCKKDFTIDEDDFSFYEKMKVPPPSWCRECRIVRRMVWRNHRSFYKRSCSLCNKTLISVYKEDGASVMCGECWNSDQWDPYQHGKDIDWTIPFLTQIDTLFKVQPRVFQYRLGGNIVNSDYSNSVVNSKNAYLCFSVLNCEDVLFSENIDDSKNSMDSLCVANLDQCSWNIDSSENYNCHFVVQSQKNIDSSFLYDSSNCRNCCLSSNLRNKSYIFRNKQLTKEVYVEEMKKLRLDTSSGFEQAKTEFTSLVQKAIHRFAQIFKSENATGDHIRNSKDISSSFDIGNSENISKSYRIIFSRDIQDCCWVLTGELEYETISGSNDSNRQIGCAVCFNCQDIEYSLFCRSSKNCFGCVGLKNAEYCILNKQYTKEEYLELIPKLHIQMAELPFTDQKGRVYSYGNFFPFEFSPFGYNETLAHDYFPVTEEEAKAKGYNWKDREKKDYKITLDSKDLPDGIEDVQESILNEVIACPNTGNQMYQCTTAFKIVPEELQFYRQKKLPFPRFCPNCRHYMRLKYRNPMRLYSRECMCDIAGHYHEGSSRQGGTRCPNEFETSYAPDRPEKVYCESCYQKEVI